MENVAELKTRIRSELDDPARPDFPDDQLWSDADLNQYITDAEQQFCRKVEILRDSATKSLCQLTLKSTTNVYNLNPRVIRVIEASIASVNRSLVHKDYAWIKRNFANLSTDTGTPIYFATDYAVDKIFVYPRPAVDLILEMHVARLPLEDVGDDTDVLEVPAFYYEKLISWVKHRAYSKHDVETLDLNKAEGFRRQFNDEMDDIFRQLRRRQYNHRIVQYAGP